MGPLSVLLVDDNRHFLGALSSYLQGMGEGEVRVVETVSDSREAVTRATATQPDIVLLDMNMPYLSGLDLLPRLRALLPQAIIVMVTMEDEEDVRQATLALGADGFVSKLEITGALWPTIQRLVSARRGTREAACG